MNAPIDDRVRALHFYYLRASAIRADMLSKAEVVVKGKSSDVDARDIIAAEHRMSVFYGLIYVVTEGFQELRLKDATLESLFTDDLYDKLRRYHDSIFHYHSQWFLSDKHMDLHVDERAPSYMDRLWRAITSWFVTNVTIPTSSGTTSPISPITDRSEILSKELAAETELLARKLSLESPRGIILIIAAYAEESVERLLRTACVKAGDPLRELFASPLGAFSARIKACWCFGLLPEDEYHNLEQLRKLRNHVAHNLDTIDFDDPKVKSHISNIRVAELGSEDPIARLAYIVATLRSWLRLAIPEIANHDLPKLLARAASNAVADWKRAQASDG